MADKGEDIGTEANEAAAPESRGTVPIMTTFTIETPGQEEQPARDNWSFNWEFGATMVACTTNTASLWRLPYLFYRSGGLSVFFSLYFVFTVLFALPLMYMDLSLGQFSGKGPVHIWNFCPILRGTGVGMVIVIALMAPLYNTMLSWNVFYLFHSFSMPWMTCDNYWNTPNCFTDQMPHSNTSFEVSYRKISPAVEYFEREVLQTSHSIESIGPLQWKLVGCLALVFVLIFLTLFWSVRVLGKVALLSVILIFGLVLILLIRGITLDGAVEGIAYLLYPSVYHLRRFSTWVEAMKSALYSVAVGSGIVHTLASYKKFRSTTLRDSGFIVGTSIIFSVVAPVMVFSLFGALAKMKGLAFEGVVDIGTSVIFVSLPEIFGNLPVAKLWTFALFFTSLLILLTTQFVHVEVLVTALYDILPHKGHKARAIITAAVCGALVILTLPLLTRGGIYYFVLLDWYVAFLAFPVFLLFQCISVSWIYGIGQFSNDIQMMTGMRPPVVYKPIWCFLLPAVSVVILVYNIYNYNRAWYNGYQFPVWADVIGWFISLAPLAPLPIFFLFSFTEPRRQPFLPSPDWGPADANYKTTYANQRKIQTSVDTNQRYLQYLITFRNISR